MLKIYDQNHRQLGTLTKYTNLKIESVLSSADKTLSFTVKDPDELPLKNEYYVRNQTDEFVIKQITHKSWSDMTVTCLLNLEEMQGQPFALFTVADKELDDSVRIALSGTGWTIGTCNVEKKRNAGMIDCNALQVIDNLCTAWMCEHSFDSINKKVNLYNRRGSFKGAYFIDGLNLKRITKASDSYDFYTIIIPYGQNGLTIESVNNGKNYLENYQYSMKRLAYIWKDESYTDPQILKEDAELKLDEMSRPVESYSCEIIDLAKQHKEYGVLSFELGDEIKLINRETKTLTRQRITKLIEYPENPEKNSCEFSSTVLTFTEMQEKLNKASGIVNYVISGDGRYTGTINVSDIINLEKGIANSTTLKSFNQDLSALQIAITEMKEQLSNIGDMHENFAELNKGNIPSGWVDNAMIRDKAVTSAKMDIQDIITSIFSNAIMEAKFINACIQNPVITGATIEADTLTVKGRNITKLIESISEYMPDIERITDLEEKVSNILSALSNVIADEPSETGG